MFDSSQKKVQRLLKRVTDYKFAAAQSRDNKSRFVIDYYFNSNVEEDMVIIINCVNELSEEDLNSICSAEEISNEFKRFVTSSRALDL